MLKFCGVWHNLVKDKNINRKPCPGRKPWGGKPTGGGKREGKKQRKSTKRWKPIRKGWGHGVKCMGRGKFRPLFPSLSPPPNLLDIFNYKSLNSSKPGIHVAITNCSWDPHRTSKICALLQVFQTVLLLVSEGYRPPVTPQAMYICCLFTVVKSLKCQILIWLQNCWSG